MIVPQTENPTEKGKQFYPDTDGYYDGYACTCKPNCEFGCKGECGCRACHASYGDFLSCE